MRNLIKKNPRYSKRINYDALRDLFERPGSGAGTPADEKIDLDADLWHMDRDDEEMGEVIEEGGGGVGLAPAAKAGPSKTTAAVGSVEEAEGEVEEDMFGYASDKAEDYEGWDAYEQEV